VSWGFDVSYASPTEGTMTFSWTGPLSVDGTEVPLHGDKRFDNAFGTTALRESGIEIGDGRASLTLDLATGDRRAELRRRLPGAEMATQHPLLRLEPRSPATGRLMFPSG
jgi:hypothetical protein